VKAAIEIQSLIHYLKKQSPIEILKKENSTH
jgi:hypothetical protein